MHQRDLTPEALDERVRALTAHLNEIRARAKRLREESVRRRQELDPLPMVADIRAHLDAAADLLGRMCAGAGGPIERAGRQLQDALQNLRDAMDTLQAAPRHR